MSGTKLANGVIYIAMRHVWAKGWPVRMFCFYYECYTRHSRVKSKNVLIFVFMQTHTGNISVASDSLIGVKLYCDSHRFVLLIEMKLVM